MTDVDHKIDYLSLFQHAPGLCLLLKPNPPEFTILDASNTYLKATLTNRTEIRGKALFVVFPDNPGDRDSKGTDNLRSSLARAMAKKQTDVMAAQKYDVPLPPELGKGFEEKYWNPKNTPILNERGEILYILHEVEDITAAMQLDIKRKKEAEINLEMLRQKSLLIKENDARINMILEALLKYTTMDFSVRLSVTEKGDELDAIVVGLNSLIDELENNIGMLKSSNQALEYANNELDSFSYSVSHDLRAPLRGINGYAQVLLEDYSEKLDGDGRKNIDVIMKNALKMGNLIDDLLTFSRIGKQNISKVQLNMESLVQTVIHDLKPESGPAITFDVKHLDNMMGDNNMMIQVLTNLISNAIKYSSKKETPHIEIGSYINNDMVVYYIKDNGAGFDMKYYDKLFGVFQRLHGSVEFDGTGVGLALVQRIIKKHRGEIWAEATPGEGASFFFSLPIKTNENGRSDT